MIRKFNKVTDSSYVFITFLRSSRVLSPNCNVTDSVFDHDQPKLIDRLIDNCNTLVFCDDVDENTLLGFINYKENSCNFVHVKFNFRRLGICKKLFDAAFEDFKTVKIHATHRPRLKGKHRLKFWFDDRFVYNPFLLNDRYPAER